MVSILASGPRSRGFKSRIRSFFQKKILVLLGLLKAHWTVKGLIKLIKLIQYWLVASYYCKKVISSYSLSNSLRNIWNLSYVFNPSGLDGKRYLNYNAKVILALGKRVFHCPH